MVHIIKPLEWIIKYSFNTIASCLAKTYIHIQGDSGDKVSILEGDTISHLGRTICVTICLILNAYRERALLNLASTVRPSVFSDALDFFCEVE